MSFLNNISWLLQRIRELLQRIIVQGSNVSKKIKYKLINKCGVSDKYFQFQDPSPEVGTQGSEGKMYRLLMFLLCDVFLEKEKDLFLWYILFSSSVTKNANFCVLLFIFGKKGRVSSSFFG